MRNALILIMTCLGCILLTACGGGAETATPTPPPAAGTLPLCAAGDLVAPLLVSPAEGEIGPVYGAEVITEVNYPDATCQPEAFEKFVGTVPSLDEDNFIINPSPVNILVAPDGFNGSGQLTTTLEDCTQYYWKARAVVGGTAGPFSDIHTFFTNFGGGCAVPEALKPVCSPNTLVAPNILAPLQNEINPEYATEVITEIEYPDATCSPEYFEKYVTEDDAFAGANFIINPGPVNIPAPLGEFSGSGQITTTLNDCTQYYLRARAVVNGAQGPFSETVTFFVDFNGTCELPADFVEEAGAVPSQNANCREGNSNQFDIVDTLFAGVAYTPIGVGPDHLWLLFKAPASSGNCWAYVQNLEISCKGQAADIANLTACLLPIVNYPPPPTAMPTPTFTPEPEVPYVAQCADGLDNDNDRWTDYPNDTSCFDANDNDESN